MSARPFIILGNPRSGTSLLRNVLNAHPKLIVPPECGFLLWLRPTFEDLDWNSEVKERFIHEVRASKKFETWDLPEVALRNTIMPAVISGYAQAAGLVYEAYALHRGKHIDAWGDKNNYYVKHVAELTTLLPDARYVHIVRDPRDVFRSYLDLGKRDIRSKYVPVLSNDAAQAAEEWAENNERVLRGVRDAGHAYTLVRYEDLVGAFQPTMRALFTFLGVDMPVGFNERSHLVSLDEPAEFLRWKEKVTEPVDTTSVGRYRQDLDPPTITAIEHVAERTMERFGYARTGGK